MIINLLIALFGASFVLTDMECGGGDCAVGGVQPVDGSVSMEVQHYHPPAYSIRW